MPPPPEQSPRTSRVRDLFDRARRQLAMKVRRDRRQPWDSEAARQEFQRLGQFLEEARVASQLDHPGVVPVHDLGIDQAGRVWFTMRLIKGCTASEVFADAHAGRSTQKGELHRHLKPANVMVGWFGEGVWI